MFSWFKSNPLFAGIAALVLIVAVFAFVRSCDKREADEEANLVNQGITIERDASKSEVINHVKEARDAVDNPSSDERNVVCSKYDRNCPNSK